MFTSKSDSIHYWYVIYTYPCFEKKIESSLLKKNITCFLPLKRNIRQWSDRKKVVHSPLFPNYLFVHTTPAQRFDLLSIYGVSKFITFNGKPVFVSDNEINTIRKISNSELIIERFVEKGDIVQIVDGPFTGLEGVVFERKGKTRIGVKIESINQFLSIEVCQSYLRSIHSSSMVLK